MPKIKLNSEIAVSRDLFSRLQGRGMLDSSGAATEDLYFYIQECLARDDSRMIVMPVGVGVQQVAGGDKTITDLSPPPPAGIVESGDASENVSEPEPVPAENKAPPVKSGDIRSRIGKLYGKGGPK